MALPKYILIACAFVLMAVQEANTIRCFECNSHTDARCAEKAPVASLSIDCSEKREGAKYTFCRKTTQIIEFSVNNLPPDTRTIRSCGFEEGNYKNRCYQRSGFGGRQEVCACSEDLCNASTNIKASFGVLLAALVAVVARL